MRKLCEKYCENRAIDFDKWSRKLVGVYKRLEDNQFQANLVRIYYYDALVDKKNPEYITQKEFFDSIDGKRFCTVRLGRLVRSSKKRFKQKGVDILMAIDAVSKAHQDQYDTGVFLVGDGDFIPLVEAVKDAGKKTFLLCHPDSTSADLMRCFDIRIFFRESDMKLWVDERQKNQT